MEFDLHRSLQDQHGSAETLQRQILEASKYGTNVSLGARSGFWRASPVRSLTKNDNGSIRFFIPSTPAGRTSSWRLKRASSSVSNQDKADSCSNFRVTKLHNLSGPHRYLAVSYCWPRGAEKERLKNTDDCYMVRDDRCATGKRKTRALKSIIDRSVAFANDRRINMIWIDQECIDQDDREDKECGIRSMDGIFHRAIKVVAFLQTAAINDPADAEALRKLSQHQHLDPDQYRTGVNVVKCISEDPWFTRAWTLQEATSGGNTLELSMKCDPTLKRGDTEDWGFVKNEIQFDWAHIAKWIAGLYAQAAIYDRDPPSSLGSDERKALIGKIDGIRLSLMNHFPLGDEPIKLERPRLCCNASVALMFLKGRFNSRAPDRISILANLSNYTIKLNTTKIGMFSMSSCVIAQALLNGDLSLLSGIKKGEYTEPSDGNCFSWLPRLDMVLQDVVPHREGHQILRLSEHSITEFGLSLPGFCWIIDQRLDMRNIRRQYLKRWKETDRRTEEQAVISLLGRIHRDQDEPMGKFHDRLLYEAAKYSARSFKLSEDEYGDSPQHIIGSQILCGVLRHLVKQGHLELANSIWFSTRRRFPAQTSEEMRNGLASELPATLNPFVADATGKKSLALPAENTKASRLFVSMEGNWEWLIERVMNDGALWAGQTHVKYSATINQSTPCVFDVSSQCIVLTPHCKGMEEMEDSGRLRSHSLPPMRSKRISWIIEPLEEDDGLLQKDPPDRLGKKLTKRKSWRLKSNAASLSPLTCTTKGMVAGMWELGKIRPARFNLV